tara:strand:- start:631 stop:864 length:234 start_codon:yes stop_codon:yes gene_type:complete
MKSNCLLGALVIKRRAGGIIVWRPGWSEPGVGWHGFLGNPWGHWSVLAHGRVLSFSTPNKNLVWYKQLWFEGNLKIR